MRALGLLAVGLAVCSSAWAQQAPGEGRVWLAQLAPLQQQQWQQPGATIPPSRVFPGTQTPRPAVPPDGSGNLGQVAPAQGGVQTAMPPPAPVMRPDVWLPARAVRLQALDKVNAQTTALTIKVGQSATFGSLTIDAKSCMVRPPDRPADAAAYLAVTDSHSDAPGFDGWMLVAEPALSMMQHPVYDLRVVGCV